MAMKAQVDLDTKTFLRFWLVVFALAAVGWFIFVAKTPLIIIGISIFLAAALTPPVNKLASILPGGSRIGGTALAYVIVIAVLGGFIFLIVPPIVQQTAKFAQTVPDMVNQVINGQDGISQFVQRYDLQDQLDNAAQSIKDNASEWASNIGSTVITGIGSLARATIGTLITLVMTFFMLIEGPTWMRRLWSTYQDHKRMERHRKVAHKIYKVITSYVNGQLLIAAIAGLLAGVTTAILSYFFDFPANLAFPVAAIIAVFSLIPMFGATIGGVLASVLIAFNDFGAAIVFAVYLIIYQQIEGNLITTYVQSKTLDLSPLAVLIAVTVGTYVFGILGGLISIPVLGIIQVLVREHLNNRGGGETESKGPIRRAVERLQGAKS